MPSAPDDSDPVQRVTRLNRSKAVSRFSTISAATPAAAAAGRDYVILASFLLSTAGKAWMAGTKCFAEDMVETRSETRSRRCTMLPEHYISKK